MIDLLNCGHFGIRQFVNGEEFCQQCFDEYNTMCKEAFKEWDETHLSNPKLEDINKLKPEHFSDYEKFKKD